MKHLFISLLLLIGFINKSHATTFYKGDNIVISSTINDNLYLAGESVIIDAAINGDLFSAGEKISINDSIYDDVFLAGADIFINAYIADDARIAGESISIMKSIKGDLIVVGASVEIHKDVVIDGDLIILGGDLIINGTINGYIKAMGKKVVFNGVSHGGFEVKARKLYINGSINGPSSLSARKIILEDGAHFHQKVEYWQKEGESDFSPYLVNTSAIFDNDLNLHDDEENWKYLGKGFVTFWIFFLLAMLLNLIVIEFIFPKVFQKAGAQLLKTPARNFGYGALFIFGLPFIILFLMVTIIGIPISVILLNLYIFSMLFSFSITSIIVANGINKKYKKDWSKWKLIGVSLLTLIALKVLAVIPFIGYLFGFIVIGMAFGTLIILYVPWVKNGKNKH